MRTSAKHVREVPASPACGEVMPGESAGSFGYPCGSGGDCQALAITILERRPLLSGCCAARGLKRKDRSGCRERRRGQGGIPAVAIAAFAAFRTYRAPRNPWGAHLLPPLATPGPPGVRYPGYYNLACSKAAAVFEA